MTKVSPSTHLCLCNKSSIVPGVGKCLMIRKDRRVPRKLERKGSAAYFSVALVLHTLAHLCHLELHTLAHFLPPCIPLHAVANGYHTTTIPGIKTPQNDVKLVIESFFVIFTSYLFEQLSSPV